MFVCGVCEKSFTNKANLSRHGKIHENATFSCGKCTSTFSRKDNLVRHVKNLHKYIPGTTEFKNAIIDSDFWRKTADRQCLKTFDNCMKNNEQDTFDSTMETNCFSGGKRARDDAYELPAKKLKTDIKDKFKERESNIWNLVPSIVFELVTLLKSAKSEDETKSKQKMITHEKKNLKDLQFRECKVLLTNFRTINNESNENNEVIKNNNKKPLLPNVDILDSAEKNSLTAFKSSVEDSIHCLEELDVFSDVIENDKVQTHSSLNTSVTLKKPIEESIQKEKFTHEKKNLKDLPFQDDKVLLTNFRSINNESNENNEVIKNNNKKPLLPNVDILDSLEKNGLTSFKSTFEESIQCLEELDVFSDIIENDKVQTHSTLSTTVTPLIKPIEESIQKDEKKENETNVEGSSSSISLSPTKCNSQNDIVKKTDNTLQSVLLKRVKTLEFLKKLCLKDISEIPTTKPNPCICQYCKYADNLPNEYSAVNNQFTYFNNDPNFHNYNQFPNVNEMYSSNATLPECYTCATSKGIYNDCFCENKFNSKYKWKKSVNEETPKNIWLKDLVSLVRHNETKTFKTPAPKDNNDPIHMKSVMNKVYKAAEKIKNQLPFCKTCNKSILTLSSKCECIAQNIQKEYI